MPAAAVLALHEGGHLVGGRLAGFRVQLFIVRAEAAAGGGETSQATRRPTTTGRAEFSKRRLRRMNGRVPLTQCPLDVMTRAFCTLLLVAGPILLAPCSSAQLPDGVEASILDVTQEAVASGFTIPWAVAVISEDEYLITERLGSLHHYRDGKVVALEGIPKTMTVTFGGLTYGGLMDVSLHPRFGANRMVYVAYVNDGGRMAVARFRFDERAVQDLEVLFEFNAFSIGSRIAWEDDAHFFVTQGMGGYPYPEPGAQALSHDGGKIHRLAADGRVPPDNPVMEGATEPSSIWSLGHRDPQGLFFDEDERVLYATEHGPLGGDELNVVTRGGNYGWPLFSYGLNYDGTPVSEMTEEEARRTTVLPQKGWGVDFNMAPSGLERLEGTLFPALKEFFVMGALAQRRLIAYDPASMKTLILLDNVGRVRDVAELPGGSLLILLDAGSSDPSDTGRVVKLTPR